MELAVAASGGPPCEGCARLSQLDLRTPPAPQGGASSLGATLLIIPRILQEPAQATARTPPAP